MSVRKTKTTAKDVGLKFSPAQMKSLKVAAERLTNLTGEKVSIDNIFDRSAAFLRKLADQLDNLKLSWIVKWLVPKAKDILEQAAELLRVVADALDAYGEN